MELGKVIVIGALGWLGYEILKTSQQGTDKPSGGAVLTPADVAAPASPQDSRDAQTPSAISEVAGAANAANSQLMRDVVNSPVYNATGGFTGSDPYAELRAAGFPSLDPGGSGGGGIDIPFTGNYHEPAPKGIKGLGRYVASPRRRRSLRLLRP